MGNVSTILVGREVSGKGTIKVPSSSSMVGRNHAKINLDMDNGTVTIEEVDAKNGTYVNGRRVARSCALNIDDEVWLGEIGPLGYKLDTERLVKGVRTDYSEEFKKVIAAYEEYYAESRRLRESKRRKASLPIKIVSWLVAVAGLVLFFVFQDIGVRIAAVSAGSVICASLNLIDFGKKDDLDLALTDLQMQYMERYRCPKCGQKFNLNTHWRMVQSNHCPNPKCNAKYK